MSAEATVLRLRQAFEMSELGFHLMRQTLRRQFPNATDAELGEKFAEWITDRPPMSGVDLKVISPKPHQRPSRQTTQSKVRRSS